jgi:Domain of unknown function (DUF4261)
VYWVPACATHHPEFVTQMAHSDLPLPVWVGISLAQAEGTSEALSVGMAQFKLPNLLLRGATLGGAELEFFYDLLAYVLRRKKKVRAGERVGRTENERLPVTYEPSPLGGTQKVWVVELPPTRPKRRGTK